ncbi:Frataxin [Amanita muscaria]
MLPRTLRLVARRSIVPSQRLLLGQCTRARMVLWPAAPHDSRPRHRSLTTPPPHINESNLAMEQYHQLSDATMETLLASLEELLDSLGRPSYEVEYHSGVLTLILGDKGTYVINKQPPNRQIWLSSPFSGPKRYDYSEEADAWVYSREDRSMGHLLNDELSQVLERDVDVRITKISDFAQ